MRLLPANRLVMRNRCRFVLLGLLLWQTAANAQISPPRMARTPDIHGDKVVFSAEGDLWLGSLTAGTAERLTTHEGIETHPRFSPDGRLLAFTGGYDGGQDVYVMSAMGEAPRRLTFDPAGAEMVSWTPDSKSILFRSRRATPITGPRLYLVPINGGVPTPLPMERAAQGSFAPDGKRLAYCRLPMESHRWKRYKGGQANRVWIGDLEKKAFKKINDDTINEQYPVWIGDSIYYVSERDGTANLWRYDTKTGRSNRLTAHDSYDVRAPASDGQRVIYEYGNDLWLYDIKTGKDALLKLTLASDRIHARSHLLPASSDRLNLPGTFSLGPTGKRLVLEKRGQLATLAAEKGEVHPIASLLGTRAKQPVWSPDGKTIAFVSDRSGEENLWIAPANGEGAATQITTVPKMRLNNPVWSPDSKRIALSTNTLALWLVDIETKKVTEAAKSDYGEITSYAFAPDGKWLAYTRPEDFFVQSLYLYNLAQQKTTRLTNPPTRDSNPVFDPAGKYLYFLSERSVTPKNDAFDFQTNFDKSTKIYLFTLAADTPSPLPIESDEEPGTLPAPPAKPEEKKETPAGKLPDVKVELDGIAERILELPIGAGSYSSLDARTDKIFYLSREDDAAKLKAYDFSAKKETELLSGVESYDLSADGKKMAVRSPAGIQIVDAGSPVTPGTGKVDQDAWLIEINPELEWKQIFLEAWRNHRDIFYDPNTHGRDWDAIRRKYEALLPSVGARSELNEIIGEMQGEMNVSHEFVGGGYQRRTAPPSLGFGAIAADLTYDAANKAYQFRRIFKGDGFEANTRSPLLTPGLNLKEGDYLFAINGTPLKPDQDPTALLIGQGGKTITLRVNSKPTPNGARTVRLKALPNDGQARYYDWVGRNRDYVAKNGGANIGYIHIPDMVGSGMAEFTKHFYANLEKQGIILDVRYNSGGSFSSQILERLHRIIFEYDQARFGTPIPFHLTGYIGRVIVICNEETSSDGEYFSTGFRYMKLGTTVGTRTWGGYAAVNGFPMIDGGFVTTPVASSFTPEGKWLPDGYGFNPDHLVEEDPNAFVAGRDPQLDKAIELLKAEIAKDPPKRPGRQTPLSKEKAFAPNKK